MSAKFDMLVKTFHGFEDIVADEIRSFGGENIENLKRAVSFSGDKRTLYRMNYESRFSLNILVPIFGFTANNTDEIYDGVQRINWDDFLALDKTFSIHATISSELYEHSQFVVLKVKDAIVDQFRDKYQDRPSIDTENPDLKIQVHIYNDEVTISLDSTGEPLYKRGYRKRVGEAHLNEVLAAGLIKLSEWKCDVPFLDPMCGSGTILAEAGMLLTNTPSGKYRKAFGFQKWRDYDEKLWTEVKNSANNKISASELSITGFELDMPNVELARINTEFLSPLVQINIIKADMMKMKPPYSAGFIIVNPPYGERLRSQSVPELYAEMGTTLKHQYSGYRACIISSNFDALKNIGLKTSRRFTVFNGPLECKFQCFDLYAGTKKIHKKEEN